MKKEEKQKLKDKRVSGASSQIADLEAQKTDALKLHETEIAEFDARIESLTFEKEAFEGVEVK